MTNVKSNPSTITELKTQKRTDTGQMIIRKVPVRIEKFYYKTTK